MKIVLPIILSGMLLSGRTTEGSTGVIYNSFYDSTGSRAKETYILRPDRALKLTRRVIVPDFPSRNGS